MDSFAKPGVFISTVEACRNKTLTDQFENVFLLQKDGNFWVRHKRGEEARHEFKPSLSLYYFESVPYGSSYLG